MLFDLNKPQAPFTTAHAATNHTADNHTKLSNQPSSLEHARTIPRINHRQDQIRSDKRGAGRASRPRPVKTMPDASWLPSLLPPLPWSYFPFPSLLPSSPKLSSVPTVYRAQTRPVDPRDQKKQARPRR